MQKKLFFFDSDALKNFHKRIFFSIIIFVLVYFIAIYRIVDVMILDQSNKIPFNNDEIIERGKIYDRNGNLLSSTIYSAGLSVNPNKIKDKNYLAKKLSNIISLPEKKLLEFFNKKSNFVWIKRSISPKEHQSIIDLGEVALQTKHKLREELKRFYPYGSVSSHVLGYTNIEGIGQSGIERGLENQLNKGQNINLSIDINLQQAVRNEILNSINQFSADAGFSLIMDVNNGEILSMVSLPDFDPNNLETLDQKNAFNKTIEGNYELGSVFKPITVSIGIDKGIINSDMKFDVSKSIRGVTDFEPHNGYYSVKDIIVNSSNIGTAKIAKLIGKKNQKEFFSRIGFDKKINFEIKESAKPLGNKHHWGEHETMRIGFGYGFSITPLHLATGYASLVNNGNKTDPTLLKQNIKQNSSKIAKDETSSYFKKLLRAVVLETKVTGKKVNIDGYEIGGKTGTANILNKFGKYEEGKNITSFIAVFPISKPKYVVLSSIINPKKTDKMKYRLTGATVAAPLVKNIIIRMIEILNISTPNLKEILKADISNSYNNYNVTL